MSDEINEAFSYGDEDDSQKSGSFNEKTDFSYQWWEVSIIVVEVLLVIYTVLVMLNVAPFF